MNYPRGAIPFRTSRVRSGSLFTPCTDKLKPRPPLLCPVRYDYRVEVDWIAHTACFSYRKDTETEWIFPQGACDVTFDADIVVSEALVVVRNDGLTGGDGATDDIALRSLRA